MKILLASLCVLQFGSTVLYVQNRRQISEELMDGFTYIKNNTNSDAMIIYPGYIMLETTNRRFGWTGNLPDVLNILFWNKDESKVKSLLKSNQISHIAVQKTRVYDDSEVHHFGGYPKSFVDRLPHIGFIKLIFENEAMSIWEIENTN